MRKQLTRLKNLKYECILFVVSNNLYMFKDVLMVSVEHSGTRNQNRSAHASHEVLRYPLVIKLSNGQSPINGGFRWFCWEWPASQCIPFWPKAIWSINISQNLVINGCEIIEDFAVLLSNHLIGMWFFPFSLSSRKTWRFQSWWWKSGPSDRQNHSSNACLSQHTRWCLQSITLFVICDLHIYGYIHRISYLA